MSCTPQHVGCSLRPTVEQGVENRKIRNKLTELLRIDRMLEVLPNHLNPATIERIRVMIVPGTESRQIAYPTNRGDDPRDHFALASSKRKRAGRDARNPDNEPFTNKIYERQVELRHSLKWPLVDVLDPLKDGAEKRRAAIAFPEQVQMGLLPGSVDGKLNAADRSCERALLD